jgi:hypothetical protein
MICLSDSNFRPLDGAVSPNIRKYAAEQGITKNEALKKG